MTASIIGAVPDPRTFRPASEAPPIAQAWYALADGILGAETGVTADAQSAALRASLAAAITDSAFALDDAIVNAPSPAIARLLWRELDAAWMTLGSDQGLDATVFAIPLVLVAAMQRADVEAIVPGVLGNVEAIAAVLREGRALGANETFALANALGSASALDVERLPQWLALRDARVETATSHPIVPAPMRVHGTTEAVHLRFLCGRAVHAALVDLLRDAKVGSWGMPLTRALVAELAVEGLSLLALPRAPARPLPARHHGLVAQREVSAQVFASNAIRKLRASVGEPQAVISAHRASDAPGGGELRLSLSSPFDAREAEGFRCPVFPIERVSDAASMLIDLLHDCRVSDVRIVAGVHADRVPGNAMPLLFKPETVPGGDAGYLQ